MLENIRLCKLTEKEAKDVMNYIGSIKEELSNPMLMMYGNPELLQYRLSQGYEFIISAIDSNESIVGLLCAISNLITDPENNSWGISLMHIQPEFRNQSVGDALLEEFIRYAKEKGTFKISSSSPPEDVEKQVMLLRQGFRQEGYVRHGKKQGSDMVLYALNLE